MEKSSIFDNVDPQPGAFDDLVTPPSVFDGEPPDATAKPISLAQKIWNDTPQAQRPKTIAADTWNGIVKAGMNSVADATQFFDRIATPRMGQSPEDYEARLQRHGAYQWARDVKAGSNYSHPTDPVINDNPFSKSISGLGALAPAVALGAIPGIGLAAGAAFMGASTGGAEYDRAREEGASIDQAKLHGTASGILSAALNSTVGPLLRLGRIGAAAAQREAPAIVRGGVDRLRQSMAANPGTSAYVQSALRSMFEQPIQGAVTDASAQLTYGSKERSPFDLNARLADLASGATSGLAFGGVAAGHAVKQRAAGMRRVAAQAIHEELQRPTEQPRTAPMDAMSDVRKYGPPIDRLTPTPASRIEAPVSKTESQAPMVEVTTAPAKSEPPTYYSRYIEQRFGDGYSFEQSTLPPNSGGISLKPGSPKVVLIDPKLLREIESVSYEPEHFMSMLDEKVWDVKRTATPPPIQIEAPLPAKPRGSRGPQEDRLLRQIFGEPEAYPTPDTTATPEPTVTTQSKQVRRRPSPVPKWKRKRRLYWPPY